jgi:hypothetical protein
LVTIFYKSEKSFGRVSTFQFELVSSVVQVVFQNILSHNTLICLNILSGEEYFVTSNHRSAATLGKTNIDKTITASQIRAYLIELIAGLILSSFPHDRISKTHPHKMYNIEKTQANSTIIEIANKIKSQNSILEENIPTGAVLEVEVDRVANAVNINIVN